MKNFGGRVSPSIGQRAAFVDAFGAGEWIGDYAPTSMAALEMDALAKAVRRLLK